MTTRYVGAGGNDANDGLSWANRKLTLNGAEDTPVAAGDVIYVGPGVYRETLTCDVSGTNGNPITYIADVTGEHTDGVGGIVRVTGSDNDTTATRNRCFTGSSINYRTFRGFMMDLVTDSLVYCSAGTNWVVEDCTALTSGNHGMQFLGAVAMAHTIRRCFFTARNAGNRSSILFSHTSTQDGSGCLVENCIFLGYGRGVNSTRIGNITVKNSLFIGNFTGVAVVTALAASQTVNVYNSIFYGCTTALSATVTTEFTENYNSMTGNNTDRTNVTAGANSNTYDPLFWPQLLLDGFNLPQAPMLAPSPWSPIKAITGSSQSSEDFYGVPRPATAAKISWGPFQYTDVSRNTGTRRGVSGASLKLADAGRVQFQVPVTNASTTFSVYVNREANYAGTNPQMIIKQPGQADTTVTDAGSAGTFNQLTTTMTPAASPGFVTIELVSNNTATSGSYACYFDDLTVS